ncbi:MAG: hypothetical protein R3C53_06690 [Pirellulaceae bacterium]
MKYINYLALGWALFTAGHATAQGRQYAADAPRPTPLTRPALKQLIEDVKSRTPRIPLPELSDEDRSLLGDRAQSYEARLKYHYLGEAPSGQPRRRGVGLREQDPQMTLDYGFKVELFWIVSRTNNCQYCLGHQETKLLSAGRSEEQIAALDCNWSAFTPAERTAFAFARKFTFEPHLLEDRDFQDLRQHFSPLQILEMCLSMSWNNSINRWKEGVGVPQNADEGGYSRLDSQQTALDTSSIARLSRGTYLTPTPQEFLDKPTTVATSSTKINEDQTLGETVARRASLEEAAFVVDQLQQVVHRKPRFPLVDAADTQTILGVEDMEVTNWLRLLANFPLEGKRRSATLIGSGSNDELSPLLQAQLRWIVARQDRAWYATAHAWKQLRDLTLSKEEIFELDGNCEQFTEREQALFVLARNLATSPVVLTDAQVSRAVDVAGPAATVQVINFVSQLAAFDRLTEAALLPFEYRFE